MNRNKWRCNHITYILYIFIYIIYMLYLSLSFSSVRNRKKTYCYIVILLDVSFFRTVIYVLQQQTLEKVPVSFPV